MVQSQFPATNTRSTDLISPLPLFLSLLFAWKMRYLQRSSTLSIIFWSASIRSNGALILDCWLNALLGRHRILETLWQGVRHIFIYLRLGITPLQTHRSLSCELPKTSRGHRSCIRLPRVC
jgi:hypothetical protein